jgi:trehalose 6-phosphate phosphatase
MSSVLSGAPRELLRDFARSKVMVGLDFDGTLAPIVREPGRARMRSSTRELLSRVARLYPTVVISGRAQPDVVARLQGVPVAAVIGNHGLEPTASPGVFERVVRRWRPALEALAARHPGVEIEDKRYSVAVHYRKSRAKKRLLQELEQALAGLQPVRVVGGKSVVNLLPPDAPHKGVALERLRRRFGCDTAIFVGDDETDEDVFLMERPGRLLGVRVGGRKGSAAPFSIPSQASIDALLGLLAEERKRGPVQRLPEVVPW